MAAAMKPPGGAGVLGEAAPKRMPPPSTLREDACGTFGKWVRLSSVRNFTVPGVIRR